jgi:cytochrome c biogenesis factor
MLRKILLTSVVLLAISATSLRIRYNTLGWGGYWDVEIIAPWHR